MAETTKIGGPGGKFPATCWSAVLAARSEDAAERNRALGTITDSYWKPIYKYFRIRWGKPNEDAKDLTQEFFARLIEKDFLADFDPAKAKLRTFLRVCADRFASNDAKAARRLKRGGGAAHVSLDFDAAEAELDRAQISSGGSRTPADMDDFFEREFIRSLFGLAVRDLREFCESRGRQIHFHLFERYDLEDGGSQRAGYAELAREFELAPTDVTNYLAFARREFRRIALERLREMTASEAEYRREARTLLGVVPK
jgi:DNA-directed RNA polymerase specialized sigma24 family protein